MGLFLGTHINKVDKKGRVSVPSQFRAVLADQTFQGVILYPSLFEDGVVEGCGMAYLEQIAAASAAQFDVFSDAQDDLAAAIYGSSVQLAWDPEGRVILPETILAHAGVGEAVAFFGAGARFQIFNPDMLAARQAQAKERLRANRPSFRLKPEGT
jgi:MraZ protein